MVDIAERRLSAVLHADVVDSTLLVRKDQLLAYERIQAAFARFGALVESHGGIAHEMRGDAVLAEFARPSDAISAALAFQAQNAAANAALGDDIRPLVRIGISLGEVIIADGVLAGQDIVLAQRLEQIAAPGAVVVSDAVHSAVHERGPFQFTDLGRRKLKGFEEAVHAHGVELLPGAALPPATPNRIALRRRGRAPARWLWATPWTTRVALGALLCAALFAALLMARRAPVAVEPACRLDRSMVQPIEFGDATGADVAALLHAANPVLTEHINDVVARYRGGPGGRMMTYVWGAPGVGKSFFARQYLPQVFPGEHCLVKLSGVFDRNAGNWAVVLPDLVSEDGAQVLSTMPGLEPGASFDLAELLGASGCPRSDGAVPLWLIDDIDEVHPDTAAIILQALDVMVSGSGASDVPFVHVFVFGRPEGFAAWFLHPKRRGYAVAPRLQVVRLHGARYATTGDVRVLASDRYANVLGARTWRESMTEQDRTELVDGYVDYVRRMPFLGYSIRSLVLSRVITERARVHKQDSEPELKSFLLDQLLRRASFTHGRPAQDDDRYRRVIEAIAVRYLPSIDADGYFAVDTGDRVQVDLGGGRQLRVKVQTALDRSGIAIVEPTAYATLRYRFEPAWVLAHLVELHNRRRKPSHEIRSCHGLRASGSG